MTKHAQARSAAFLCAAAILTLAAAPAAYAQGTAEQREACTEDAIRLCPDAIPDVGRTEACMKTHEAQLSRRCHRVFVAQERQPAARQEAGRPGRGPDDGYSRRVDRRPPRYDDGYDAPRGFDGDDEAPRRAERLPAAPDDYDVARRPIAPDDEDFVLRRAERVPPPDPEEGYGPRRYLYLTPRGRADGPDDAY